MSPPISPLHPIEAHLTPVLRVDAHLPEVYAKTSRDKGGGAPASQAAERTALEGADQAPANSNDKPAPAKLVVRVDVEAGRFVNMLVDAESDEVLRKYPSDAQLAFSRAVKSYLRVMSTR
jgi:hypothetical protein